jgi:hypothetical protein
MGTRADFYVGRGVNAEWLGSIAWDGHPPAIQHAHRLFDATDEADWRAKVAAMFAARDDATLPEQGWPWPWTDSGTTDFAYTWDEGAVHASAYGQRWFDPRGGEPEEETPREAVFPDMSARKNVTLGRRSGLIVLGG